MPKIPKIIHYCWFGGAQLPASARRYMESWKKHLPDYELKRWDESSFDVNAHPYTREAVMHRKWAFVTDYVRLSALSRFGGIYMDTDVEVIKNLDGFLEHSAFSGFESAESIPTGIMGAEAGNGWIEALLASYDDRHFILPDGTLDTTTNVVTITNISKGLGFVPGNKYQVIKFDTHLYPKEYFCPLNYDSKETDFSEKTFTIHHFAGSWLPRRDRLRLRLKKMLSHLGPVERIYLWARGRS